MTISEKLQSLAYNLMKIMKWWTYNHAD